MAGQKAMALPQRWLGQFCKAERLVNFAEAGSNSQTSAEAVGWYPPKGRLVLKVMPATRSRRLCAASVRRDAYMRPAGTPDSFPVNRCVQFPLAGSQSQTSPRPR